MALSDIDEPIKSFSEEMADVTVKFFHNLRGINKQKIQRYCVPAGFDINHVIVDHDGSDTSYASSARIVSFNRKNNDDRLNHNDDKQNQIKR